MAPKPNAAPSALRIAEDECRAFTLTRPPVSARGVQVANDIFVVLAGSTFRAVTSSLDGHPGYVATRERLLREGTLEPDPTSGQLRLKHDVSFTSASAAATIINGYPTSGLSAWKDDTGAPPAPADRYPTKPFASRRAGLARRLRGLVQTFAHVETPDAVLWREFLLSIASDLETGRQPPGRA